MMHYDFEDGRGYVSARRHENGGGVVALTADVADTVFLAADAVVFGYAKISDNVRITGRARISGRQFPCGMSTLIEDDVSICGSVIIDGCVLLRNSAEIRGHVKLLGGVQVMHRAVISGNAELSGDVLVLDRSFISGNVKIIGDEEQVWVGNDDAIHGDRLIRTTEDVRISVNAAKGKKRGKSKPVIDARADRSFDI